MNGISGIRLDMVEIDRMEKIYALYGERFVRRIVFQRRSNPVGIGSRFDTWPRLFAAKEAFLKALGPGWSPGLRFSQVEVRQARSIEHRGYDAWQRGQTGGAASASPRFTFPITHDGAYAPPWPSPRRAPDDSFEGHEPMYTLLSLAVVVLDQWTKCARRESPHRSSATSSWCQGFSTSSTSRTPGSLSGCSRLTADAGVG